MTTIQDITSSRYISAKVLNLIDMTTIQDGNGKMKRRKVVLNLIDMTTIQDTLRAKS